MIRSPIPRVLSTFSRHRVRALLMGGQACILYGAAEFSRDIDFSVAPDPANLDRLRGALTELRATSIYFPPLSAGALSRGHACHFRCRAPGVNGLRIDVMSVMRGADPFEPLWSRRRTLRIPGVGRMQIMGLSDLVRIKKTQRDKDWPMVRRLVEADIARAGTRASADRVRFWLSECRTAALLIMLAGRYLAAARAAGRRRRAVAEALRGRASAVERELSREERREREADRRYWAPLKRELEHWRMQRPRR